MFYSLAWVTAVCCAVAGAIFIIGGEFIFARGPAQSSPVMIRDARSAGTHEFSGMVTVAQTCDQLQEHIEKISPSVYKIAFTTWREPSVPCEPGPVPREFHDILFAPDEGVDFVATQDGAPLSILIVPAVPN